MERDSPEMDCKEKINGTWQPGRQGPRRKISSEKLTEESKLCG